MALNMKTLTQALAKTAAVIEKTVQTTVQEVTGPRALQDYELLDQVGSGGPGLVWKLFSARTRATKPSQAQYPFVCVWLLDKKALSDSRTRAGLSKAAEDAFLDVIRSDANRLVRLRHPGVVHVVHALDESKTAMAMVTEPLFASVANVLGNFNNVGKVPSDLKGMELGILEIKHGLLQVSESLEFLHTNARLIHRAISPEAVFITSGGAWKLGGFGFAIPTDQNPGDSASVNTFHYVEYDVEDSVLPLQPCLNYTAPELVRSRDIQIGCSADIFSFGCVIYHLLARKPLLDCNNNVKMYTNRLMHLSHDFSSIPRELVSDLQRMIAADSLSRPTALDFTGSPFFRDDTRLRALRFLDHMLERDNMQKSEFLKALSEMWKDFDSRVLRYKVLPPLCAELRNVVMQAMILPMVLTIAESQDKHEFELSTLPALVPVLALASGETLLLLVKHAELIINKASHEHLIAHVLPLLVRAYDDTDVRIQEEVLRRTFCLAKQLDGQLVKQAILPRVHGLALKTTVAAVRVNALLCLGELVPSLDKHSSLDIVQTLQRCTAVDRSAPTLMCTLGVANSMVKQYGIEFAAEHILPLLMPLLTAQQLNVQQFGKFMLFVKDVLRRIEEKRGVVVSDSGVSNVSLKHSGANGHLSEPLKKTSGNHSSSTNSAGAWDEDWGSITKRSTSIDHAPEPGVPPKPAAVPASLPTPPPDTHCTAPTPDSHVSVSCPAVEIEWPPLAPSSSHGWRTTDNAKQNSTSQVSGNPSFDYIDPFGDWPPRTGITMNQSQNSMMNSGMTLPHGGRPATNASNPTDSSLSNNPIGLLHEQTPSFAKAPSTSGFSMNSTALSSLNQGGRGIAITPMPKRDDLAAMLVSGKTAPPPPMRLAPPPPSGKIGGRGRKQRSSNSASLTSIRNTRTPSEQPPLLDLL